MGVALRAARGVGVKRGSGLTRWSNTQPRPVWHARRRGRGRTEARHPTLAPQAGLHVGKLPTGLSFAAPNAHPPPPQVSPVLQGLVKEGKLKIVGGVYDLATGKVVEIA